MKSKYILFFIFIFSCSYIEGQVVKLDFHHGSITDIICWNAYIKYDKNDNTIFYVVIQADTINELKKKYLCINSNQYVYVKDSLNYEIGKFTKIILYDFYNLPTEFIFMKKIGTWKYVENGILRKEHHRKRTLWEKNIMGKT